MDRDIQIDESGKRDQQERDHENALQKADEEDDDCGLPLPPMLVKWDMVQYPQPINPLGEMLYLTTNFEPINQNKMSELNIVIGHADQTIGALNIQVTMVALLNASPQNTFDRADIMRLLNESSGILKHKQENELTVYKEKEDKQ